MRGILCFCTILPIALAATVSQAKAATQFPLQACFTPTEFFMASTAYKQSVNDLLLNLRLNASLTGFAAAIAGQPPNRVYGTILCYGDASSEDCRDCISVATEATDSPCEAKVMWYVHCMVRYSPSNFIGVLDSGDVISEDSPAASEPAFFSQQLLVLLSNLTAAATGNRTGMMYATGDISVTAGQTIYCLAQCTRDISLNDCGSCLANLTLAVQECCNDKTDVFIGTGTCIIRYRVPQLSSSSSAGVGFHWFRSDILVAIISAFSTAALCLGIPHAFSL